MVERIKKLFAAAGSDHFARRIAYGSLALAYGAQCLGVDKLTVCLVVTGIYASLAWSE